MSVIRIFDLPVGYSGHGPRSHIEELARFKMEKDMDGKGFDLIDGTFKVIWMSHFQGMASAKGAKKLEKIG